MKYLVRTAENLLIKAYNYGPCLLKPSYMHTRLITTTFSKTAPKSLQSEMLETHRQKIPQYVIDATSYREKIRINFNDIDAIYGLANCIGLGAPVFAAEIQTAKLASIWLNEKAGSLNVQAELYRRILRLNAYHAPAILGLAQCLRKGVLPEIQDLRNTWLEGGNFMLEDGGWGLTKPVILLLAQALEERSKAAMSTRSANPTITHPKSAPKPRPK